jgi:uncharacterized protein
MAGSPPLYKLQPRPSVAPPRTSDFAGPVETVGPVKLLVLQGTAFCNINCRYCYLPNRNDRNQMSAATVEAIVSRLREDHLLKGPLLVNWHAGEPLVLPPGFYDERIPLFDVLEEDGITVTHSLQTNGILVKDRFCELIKKYDVKVGVSVDGPAFIHDRQRLTRNGKPTHDLVLKGIRKLQEHGIPFNAICVLSDFSVRYPDALYGFFRENDIRAVAFNIEEIEGANTTSSITEAGFEERYVAFLDRFWTLVKQDGDRLRVREFDDGEGRILDQNPRRNSQVDPYVNVSVAWNGDFSTFCPELLGNHFPGYPTFTLGNVHRTGFRSALETTEFRRLWWDIRKGVDACRSGCDYFAVCGGGNPSNKISENGSFSSTETRNCSARIKRTCDFLLEKVEQRVASRSH